MKLSIVLVLVLALGASVLSCFPGRFDDLEDQTWVQFVDRDDGQVNGDIGFDIAPLDAASGGAFVTSSQASGGLTTVTFDSKGQVSNRIGFTGKNLTGGGISPLTAADIFTVTPYTVSGAITGILAGQPEHTAGVGTAPGTGFVAKLDTSLANGMQVGPSDKLELGLDILVGDFGSGAATPDIILLGATSVTLIPGAATNGETRSCNLTKPNFPTSSFALGEKNAALFPVKGNGKNQLVVSGTLPGGIPTVLAMDASEMVDNSTCAASASIQTGAPGTNPPIALVIGEFDATAGADLIVGQVVGDASGAVGKVSIYSNITFSGMPAAVPIAVTSDDGVSAYFGTRLLLDDIHGTGTNQLIVGDAAATVGSTGEAGKVFVFSANGGTCAETRGTLCLLETLSSPEPGSTNHFGRALATTQYKGKVTRKILAVGERNRVNVYFRTNASVTDPRDI